MPDPPATSDPKVWEWNWTWNCDSQSAPPAPTPPAGASVWVWNWQWDCGGSAAPPAAVVPAVCVGCNVDLSIRVLSPGDNGDVTQSIVSEAQSTVATTAAAALAVAVAPPPPPPPLPAPVVPQPPPRFAATAPAVPAPVVVAVPLPPPETPEVPTSARELLDAGDPAGSPGPAGADLPRLRGDPVVLAAGTVVVRRSVVRRAGTGKTRSFSYAEARASTHVVIVQRHTVRAPRPATRAHTRSPGAAPPVLPIPPNAPPSAPAPAAAAGPSGGSHGSGGGVVAAALAGLAGLALLAVLSGILPTSALVRRRLSDDRRSDPG